MCKAKGIFDFSENLINFCTIQVLLISSLSKHRNQIEAYFPRMNKLSRKKRTFFISDERLPLRNIVHWCQHLFVSPPPPKLLYFSRLLRRHHSVRQCHSSKNSQNIQFLEQYLEISHSFDTGLVRFAQGRVIEREIEVVLFENEPGGALD